MIARFFFAGLVVVALGGIVWFYVRPGNVVQSTATNAAVAANAAVDPTLLPHESTTSAAVAPDRHIPDGFVEYRNARYNFSLLYPKGFDASFYDMGAGAGTLTIQNTQTAQGFQIFVVPYNGDKIPEERFHMDEPSGVRLDPQNAYVDGALAATFFGRDARLGDTREIWFIYHGLLYEVTTFKSLDSWLQSTMATWRFLDDNPPKS